MLNKNVEVAREHFLVNIVQLFRLHSCRYLASAKYILVET